MLNRLSIICVMVLLIACRTIPMASVEKDSQEKSFSTKPDISRIYVYRTERFGAGIRFPVEVDGKPVGYTLSKTFLVIEVPPGTHELMWEGDYLSGVSMVHKTTRLELSTKAGENYFVWQEAKSHFYFEGVLMKPTVIYYGEYHLVDAETGKEGVKECELLTLEAKQ